MKLYKHIVFISFILLNLYFTGSAQPLYKFVFGSKKSSKGILEVSSETKYSIEKRYGFDYQTQPADFISKKARASYVSSAKPFYFSVKLPEGNYRVTVIMGNPDGTSDNMVRAESRRLMVNHFITESGKSEKKVFTVNVRTPRISDSLSIKLKPREIGYLNWDEKLTLEFTGANPCLQSIEIEKVADVITVYLAGNSTVVDQDKEPWAAWGQMVTSFFNPQVAIANYAESGESLSSFKGSFRLKKILSVIKPGDYLFIEFGHNDQKQKGPGIGPWESYTNLLREFVNEARSKGAYPVLVTSMHRRNFDSAGQVINTLGDFPAAMRKVAAMENVPLVDLNNMSKTLYEAWGPEKSMKAFVHYPANTFEGQDKPLADNTHFNTYGAYEIAKCILKSISESNLTLKSYISNNFKEFNPANPDNMDDWYWPLSPMVSNVKPDGN